MKTLKTLSLLCILLLSCGATQAQFGRQLGKTIENAAKRTIERKAEQKAEEAVSKGIDRVLDPNSYKEKNGREETKEAAREAVPEKTETRPDGNKAEAATETVAAKAAQEIKAAEMAYAKSDFVPGDEIIFDDDLSGEQMGEFPSQWDLLHGSAEVASYDGTKCIHLEVPTDAHIAPLMKDMKNYLPEVFTVEFDFWVPEEAGLYHQYEVYFNDEQGKEIAKLVSRYVERGNGNKGDMSWEYRTPSDERRNGHSDQVEQKGDAFNRLSFSFNKRAFKVYVNGIRIINIPSMKAPKNFSIRQYAYGDDSKNRNAIANIRIAQGAVPLYDRMMTDGKIITYGITFDVGKSSIKPESMGELNRIVRLMTDNPDLKFSVEGHTDSTGNEASNRTLSEARSKAIVDKLVEAGIDADRLQSAGKGQNNPIADNSTDEGRAKNRRVEFVKI
jgi:outer membrane protein OmpA-like peptidoglycan-associated protein